MAPERRIEVLEPGGQVRSVRSLARELDTGGPQPPLGIPWGRLLIVLALAISLWLVLAQAAALLLR